MKIIIYVILFTYLSLIVILNYDETPTINFIFKKFKVSIVWIFIVSIFLGVGLDIFRIKRKFFQWRKKEQDELKK